MGAIESAPQRRGCGSDTQEKAEVMGSRTHVRWPQVGPRVSGVTVGARCGGNVGVLIISISS